MKFKEEKTTIEIKHLNTRAAPFHRLLSQKYDYKNTVFISINEKKWSIVFQITHIDVNYPIHAPRHPPRSIPPQQTDTILNGRQKHLRRHAGPDPASKALSDSADT